MPRKVTLSAKFLTVDGQRAGVSVHGPGCWIEGVPPELIKLRPKRRYHFPREFHAALTIENNSDMRTDYFEPDSIRLMPGHPLYERAKSLSAR